MPGISKLEMFWLPCWTPFLQGFTAGPALHTCLQYACSKLLPLAVVVWGSLSEHVAHCVSFWVEILSA